MKSENEYRKAALSTTNIPLYHFDTQSAHLDTPSSIISTEGTSSSVKASKNTSSVQVSSFEERVCEEQDSQYTPPLEQPLYKTNLESNSLPHNNVSHFLLPANTDSSSLSDGRQEDSQEEDKDHSFDQMITSVPPSEQGQDYRPRVASTPTELNVALLKKQLSGSTESSVQYRMRTGSEETEEELGRQIAPLVQLADKGMSQYDQTRLLGQLKGNKDNTILNPSPNCKMGSVTYEQDIIEGEYVDLINHMFYFLEFIKEMNPISEAEVREKEVTLEKKTEHRKLMIFDLDETLVHCTFQDDPTAKANSDIFLEVKNPRNKSSSKAGFNIRPGARECLLEAQKHFEVVVFTASMKNYADVILDHLDPENKLIHHRFYRDSCIQRSHHESRIYVKDLRIFKDFELSDIVLVDNAVYSFGAQLDNGIPIIPFRDCITDIQLLQLIDYYPILAEQKDVRKCLRKHFKTSELSNIFESFKHHYEEAEEEAKSVAEELDQLQRCSEMCNRKSTDSKPKRKKKRRTTKQGSLKLIRGFGSSEEDSPCHPQRANSTFKQGLAQSSKENSPVNLENLSDNSGSNLSEGDNNPFDLANTLERRESSNSSIYGESRDRSNTEKIGRHGKYIIEDANLMVSTNDESSIYNITPQGSEADHC